MDQAKVACGRKEIKFQEIHFSIPDFLRKEDVPTVWQAGGGSNSTCCLGYRHMLRFYAIQIFEILDALGYDWFFRLDDDSFIHSKIDYNLFEFMEQNGFEYGYRVDIKDGWTAARGFGETVLGYVKAENIIPISLKEHWELAPLLVLLKNRVKVILMRVFPAKKYTISPLFQYDLWGYYNNFFITKIAFWKSPEVQSFIHYFDRIGGWYKYRWGDLIFQSAAIQVFMPKEKIFKFTDWTYEHATITDGILRCGGIYEGTLDKDSEAVREFKKAYGTTKQPFNGSY
jgi:alpha 1,2-mannosyltransferase